MGDLSVLDIWLGFTFCWIGGLVGLGWDAVLVGWVFYLVGFKIMFCWICFWIGNRLGWRSGWLRQGWFGALFGFGWAGLLIWLGLEI